jgi:hypothetical protein
MVTSCNILEMSRDYTLRHQKNPPINHLFSLTHRPAAAIILLFLKQPSVKHMMIF